MDIREHGIVLEDVSTGNRTITRVNVVERLDLEDAYDLVVVMLPKNHVPEILPTIAANRHIPNVLFMFNNAAGPDEMINALGRERVLIGFPGAGGTREGFVFRYMVVSGRRQPTTFGELDGSTTPRLEQIAGVFKDAGFPVAISSQMDAWLKTHVALAFPMIMIVTAQILRDAVDDPEPYNEWIDNCIAEIERDFMKPEFKAVLETVGPNGELIDHFDGRILNPGHTIESAWFIMQEAQHRGNDPHLIKLGTTILDWMWQWGWDEEYGGIIYFRDVKELPVQEYWQDMKFWWPQNEAFIATLMAYQITGDEKYARWHQMIHDWTYQYFPDSKYGEWFGYLHRAGRISTTLKGNLWKGPFHLPRMQLVSWKILEQIANNC